GVSQQRFALLFEMLLEASERFPVQPERVLPELRQHRIVRPGEAMVGAVALGGLGKDVVIDYVVARHLSADVVFAGLGTHVAVLADDPLARVRPVFPFAVGFLDPEAIRSQNVMTCSAQIRGLEVLRIRGFVRSLDQLVYRIAGRIRFVRPVVRPVNDRLLVAGNRHGNQPDASTWLVCCERHVMHPIPSRATSERLLSGRTGLSPEEMPFGEGHRSQKVPMVPSLALSTY